MKTLSVKQPWAYLLCAGIKDIENRTWKTNYRGRVFIHASADYSLIKNHPTNLFTKDQWTKLNENEEIALEFTSAYWQLKSWKEQSEFLKTSSIIGSVEIVDCVLNHESIWAEKSTLEMQLNNKCIWNWVIANPIMFANAWLNIKGKLGLWEFENMKGLYDTTQVRK